MFHTGKIAEAHPIFGHHNIQRGKVAQHGGTGQRFASACKHVARSAQNHLDGLLVQAFFQAALAKFFQAVHQGSTIKWLRHLDSRFVELLQPFARAFATRAMLPLSAKPGSSAAFMMIDCSGNPDILSVTTAPISLKSPSGRGTPPSFLRLNAC